MSLSIVILAAGKGKRMASNIPKVMHRLGGMPLLEHVIRTANSLNPRQIHIVYGNGSSSICDAFLNYSVNWIHQEKQLGTGHAVMQALPACHDNDRVLVLYGDVPLISVHTLQRLLDESPADGVGLLVTHFENPTGFGRILRGKNDDIIGIVEERDANTVQKAIREINTGIVVAPARLLKSCLPRISDKNAQKEYYLTDLIGLAVSDGIAIHGIEAMHSEEVRGVNDQWQLATLERYFQLQTAKTLAMSGVVIMDPARLDVRGQISIAPTAQLDVNVVLEGEVTIGPGCYIGPGAIIKNSTIGANVYVHAYSVVDGALLESECAVGPFARIRAETIIKSKAKVGNFVEMKKTILGEASKALHLTYLGDAVIGKDVNIGAGTITCNYDGVNKWSTEIDDGAFIGSNTSLIAPIKIGAKATIAAGSAVSKEAPADTLTIERSKQTTVPGWKRPRKKEARAQVTAKIE